MANQMSIGIIGAGRLGSNLALAIQNSGIGKLAISTRSVHTRERLSLLLPECTFYDSPQALADELDLVFICTPDNMISNLCSTLAWSTRNSVIHCSGLLSHEALSPAYLSGASVGSFHPCQTFTLNFSLESSRTLFSDAAIAISASEPRLFDILSDITKLLNAFPISIDENDRALYHAAAVMSCGGLVSLLSITLEIWRTLGFSEEEAKSALTQLTHSTVSNISQYGIKPSLTGPILRNDTETLNAHVKALLGFSAEATAVYTLLSKQASTLITAPDNTPLHPTSQLNSYSHFLARLLECLDSQQLI